MTKENSTIKSIRIDNDLLAEFKKRNPGSFSGWVNEKISEYVRGDALEELRSMSRFMGGYETMIKGLCDLCMEGSIVYDKGMRVRIESYERLKDACESRGLDIEEVMEKTRKAVERE